MSLILKFNEFSILKENIENDLILDNFKDYLKLKIFEKEGQVLYNFNKICNNEEIEVKKEGKGLVSKIKSLFSKNKETKNLTRELDNLNDELANMCSNFFDPLQQKVDEYMNYINKYKNKKELYVFLKEFMEKDHNNYEIFKFDDFYKISKSDIINKINNFKFIENITDANHLYNLLNILDNDDYHNINFNKLLIQTYNIDYYEPYIDIIFNIQKKILDINMIVINDSFLEEIFEPIFRHCILNTNNLYINNKDFAEYLLKIINILIDNYKGIINFNILINDIRGYYVTSKSYDNISLIGILIHIAEYKNTDIIINIIKKLIDNGLNLNLKSLLIDKYNKEKEIKTPLYHAYKKNNIKIIKLLKLHGAKLDKYEQKK